MQIFPTALPEVKLIVPRVHRDERGFFVETYKKQALLELAGIDATFVQDNHARSEEAGVVRGLHFQIAPNAQGKLIHVVRGAILDVVVDIRVGSSTYGRHVTAMLSADNHTQLWVPVGFAHAYCTLEVGTEVLYKVTAPYDPLSDRGLAWDDPALGIAWPVSAEAAILSDKDRKQSRLHELPA
jgi:dTDP-4-dehydrorhamnose 3,5-epimerase